MSAPRDDVPLLRAALATARDSVIDEDALDEPTAAALRRWPLPEFGSPGRAYWRVEDVEALLAGCDTP